MEQLEEWFAALAADGKGPVRLSAAVRGEAWSQDIEIAGDYTAAVLAGTLRQDPGAASADATFTVSSETVAGGTTTWTISLASGTGSNSTGVLQSDANADNTEYVPFMLFLTPDGGTKELLCGGVLPLIEKA